MWTLPVPDVADADRQLTTALTPIHGPPSYALSEIERAAILAVYQIYDDLLGQPSPDLTPTELAVCREYVQSGYNQLQIGGRLSTLRASLLASTDVCPYCGFGEPTELDHYLPKNQYHELAIYSRNLIPSCSPCNNAKRSVVPGVFPGHSFIHAYFQTLPDAKFMHADVEFVGGALSVTFRIQATELAEGLAVMLSFQLARLKLQERYPRQINKFLSEQRTGILLFNGLPSHKLVEYLLRSATSLARSFSRNDWRPVLLEALAANEAFCTAPEEYLGERSLPDVERVVV